MEIQKEKIILDLVDVGNVEVISIGDHFVLFIKGDSQSHLDSMKAYDFISNVLKKRNVLSVYPNIQSLKNESDYFLITLNK